MKLNIVLLDGKTIGYDFEWPCFTDFGSFTRHDLTRPKEVIARIKGADAVLSTKVLLDAEIISTAPQLKYIGCMGTGYNHVDVAAAARRGIVVSNIPDYSSTAVAQHVMALILEFTNQVALHSQAVHNGEWARSKSFCFWKKPVLELEGKTMGIVGYGNIGRRVAQLALAFGMRVLACARRPQKSSLPPGISYAELDELCSQADFISLHTPLTPETEKLINAKRLGMMKQSAYIINTARGPLIDEEALADALHTKRIAGAGLDVLGLEPMRPNNPLLKNPNVIITPHMAWASVEARKRLMRGVYDNLKAFQGGRPQNVVNGV